MTKTLSRREFLQSVAAGAIGGVMMRLTGGKLVPVKVPKPEPTPRPSMVRGKDVWVQFGETVLDLGAETGDSGGEKWYYDDQELDGDERAFPAIRDIHYDLQDTAGIYDGTFEILVPLGSAVGAIAVGDVVEFFIDGMGFESETFLAVCVDKAKTEWGDTITLSLSGTI